MRHLLFAAASLFVLAGTSVSEARPSTLGMTCGQAASLVASNGAVVLSTGTHTYDRFVSSPGYCMLGEYAAAGYAPTADSPRCVIGYVCKLRPRFFDDDYGNGNGFIR